MSSIELESIGKLKPHPDVPEEWFISQKIPIPFFDFTELSFVLDGYSENDESFLKEANEAIENFLAKDLTNRTELSSFVFKNYAEFVEIVGDEDMPKVKNEEDIWQYVCPKEIYVNRRHRRDEDIYIQVHCECEWEIEHGLQLVFRQGKKLTRVSSIDGHLTEADAYDKPDTDDEWLSKF